MKKVWLFLLLVPLFAGCGASKSSVKPAFDLAALAGKTISEVEAVLGPVKSGNTAATMGVGTDMKSWTSPDGNGFLLVLFETGSGRVKWFHLSPVRRADDDNRAWNQDDMLALGNLRRDAANYRLEFVDHPARSGETGAVKVLP